MSDGDVASATDVLFVGSSSALPILAWADKSLKSVKVNFLGTKTVVTLAADKKGEEIKSIKVHAPTGANTLSHFLIMKSRPCQGLT